MHEVFPFRRAVLALVFFGVAFGYLEAAVVSYLRTLHEPARQQFYPGRAPSELFPLLTLDQVRSTGPEQMHIFAVELGRETATIAMLAAVALAVARNAGQWAAAFVIAFGIWDITFYGSLKVLLDWPASLFTWDILFLLPVPWVGPVVAPVIVSAAMIAAGFWQLRSEAIGKGAHLGGHTGSAFWPGGGDRLVGPHGRALIGFRACRPPAAQPNRRSIVPERFIDRQLVSNMQQQGMKLSLLVCHGPEAFKPPEWFMRLQHSPKVLDQ